MAAESFLTRWRKAVAPLPSREKPDAEELVQRARRRRLIHTTITVLLLLGAGWFVYSYMAGGPERAQAEIALGMRQVAAGANAEAIRHFDKAISISPDLAGAYLDRAIAEHNSGDRGAALIDLEKAVELDPSLTRAYNLRGQIFAENGDARKAIDEFTKSLKAKPELEGYYQRGLAHERLGEHMEAIADFDSAIAEFPDAPYTYRARASARRALGDDEGADADQKIAARLEGSVR
jgi:tetratricopeptide (TPR) repeat protein